MKKITNLHKTSTIMKRILFTCLIVLLATLAAQAATDDVTINATNFPDANFRSYLLSLYPKGYMTQSDINSCTSLNVSSKSISNLTGIAHFTELQYLYCQNNNLSSLQLRNNTKLKTVEAHNNQLEWIDVSFCSKLEKLICNNNKLGQDPSNAAGLYGLGYSQGSLNYLDFSYNYMTSLTLGNYPYLKTLKCSNNTTLTQLAFIGDDLTTLDITGCTGLTKLQCPNNANLSSITGLSSCTAMTYLDCSNCAITDLSGVSSMTNLNNLYATNNKLTSLDVHGMANLEYLAVYDNTLLTDLRCYSCALTYLDVSGCTALTGLRCYYNDDLATITGLANCTAITYLDCEDCGITSLEGVNNMPNIATLWARNNKLTTLAVTGKTKLTNLRVSGNTTLTTLNCNSNALTSLTVTGCTGLTQFQCYSNPNLTGITGLSDCVNLTYLDMAACKFSTINVSALTKLTTLRCNSNQLTTLNVSAMSSLKYIYCYGNNLTTLDVTGCTSLQGLRCYGNSSLATITGLANCTNITYLDCEDCDITELTGVNNMTNITTLLARNNKLTTLILTIKHLLLLGNGTLQTKSLCQLSHDMVCIRRTSAIAAEKESAIFPITLHQELICLLYLRLTDSQTRISFEQFHLDFVCHWITS